MASKTIANLSVAITARTKGLRKGLKAAKKQVIAFGKNLADVAKRSTAFFAGLGAAAAGIAIGGIALANKSLSNIAKTASRLGIAPNALLALRDAAELADIPISALDTGLQRMVRRISDASFGKGEAAGAIKELGLNAQALGRMKPEKQFTAIADAMKKFPRGRQLALAVKIFDTEGADLIRVMDSLRDAGKEQGASGGLDKLVKNVLGTGRGIDERTGFIEKTLDKMTGFKQQFIGLWYTLAQEVAPAVDSVMQKITNIMGRGDVRMAMRETMISLGKAISGVLNKLGEFLGQKDRWRDITTSVKDYRDWIKKTKVDITEAMETMERLGKSIKATWDSIIQGIDSAVNSIITLIREAVVLAQRLAEIGGIVGGSAVRSVTGNLAPALDSAKKGDVGATIKQLFKGGLKNNIDFVNFLRGKSPTATAGVAAAGAAIDANKRNTAGATANLQGLINGVEKGIEKVFTGNRMVVEVAG